MLERPDDPGQGAIRIDDGDRNRAVELLREHTADGRLTLDEFSDRIGLVFEAKTRGDLDLVMADLPSVAQHVPEEQRRQPRSWAVAILSGHSQKGPWRPAQEMNALAIMGGCEIDLRQAEIDFPEITISAVAIMGGIDIIVPEGVAVEVKGIPLMGGFESRVKSARRLPGTPLIRVTGLALMGGVTVRNKRSSRDKAEHIQRKVERHVERAQEIADRHVERAERIAERHRERHQKWGGLFGDWLACDSEEEQRDWRDQLRSHAAPDGTVTIMFTDIEGYTELTERLGDLQAREILYVHNQIIREQVAACGGYEVKSQGDGFMIAFAGASRALRCALRIQGAFEEHAESHPAEPIHVRMGLHTGEALREADDFLGRTVIIASRIADEAKGGEILVSALLKELADGTGEFRFGDLREVRLKGLSQTYRVYPVEWRAD